MSYVCEICGQNCEYDEGDSYAVLGHPNLSDFVCFECINEEKYGDLKNEQ